jgi:hypothetical protein
MAVQKKTKLPPKDNKGKTGEGKIPKGYKPSSIQRYLSLTDVRCIRNETEKAVYLNKRYGLQKNHVARYFGTTVDKMRPYQAKLAGHPT